MLKILIFSRRMHCFVHRIQISTMKSCRNEPHLFRLNISEPGGRGGGGEGGRKGGAGVIY